jgi:hypothetical protein
MDYEDQYEEYDPDLFTEYGEGFETDFDTVSEKNYDAAFDKAAGVEVEIDENDYEFDEITGGRDKKPVMSALNKGRLSKYEMDDLLNTLD